MANDLTKNPWIIDTAGATSTWTGPVHIRQMEWVPAAAGDDLTVTDKNGNTIWSVTNALADGVAGKESIDLRGRTPWQGFIVSAIGGGTLYVYLD